MILDGKRILITGVITRESIGYAVAEQAQLAGAEVILTSFGRPMRLTERSAKGLPRTPEMLELDVNEPEHFERLTADLEQRWGGIDGALHAIAFAPEDALGGKFLDHARGERGGGVPDQRVLATSRSPRRCCRCSMATGASWGSTSTPRWPGRCTTGWAWPRPRSSRSTATWRATSAATACASTSCRPGRSRPSPRAASRASATSWTCGAAQAPLGWNSEDREPVAARLLLPAVRLVARHQRRDPARGRRLPRDGRAARDV